MVNRKNKKYIPIAFSTFVTSDSINCNLLDIFSFASSSSTDIRTGPTNLYTFESSSNKSNS